jgi:hypothetical protein
MLDCFLNLPNEDELPLALDLQLIATGQRNDQSLWQRHLAHPIQYPEQQFGEIQLLTYRPLPNAQWKICVPTQQLCDLIQWCHQALSYCGLHRLLKTIMMHLGHPNIHTVAKDIMHNCEACQWQKVPGLQYAYLPP